MALYLSVVTHIANMLPADLITELVESSTYKDGNHRVGGIEIRTIGLTPIGSHESISLVAN